MGKGNWTNLKIWYCVQKKMNHYNNLVSYILKCTLTPLMPMFFLGGGGSVMTALSQELEQWGLTQN